MRFSAAVLVALLSLSSSSDTAHAKKFQFPLHAVLPSRRLARARNVGGVPSAIHKDDSQSSLRRAALPLWETEEQLVQSRPLWATDEEAKKPCSGKEDVDLGILACGDGFSCSSEGYCEPVTSSGRALDEDTFDVISCEGFDQDSYFTGTCDCSEFDEMTNTGSFTCTSKDEIYGVSTYAFEVTGPGDYTVNSSVELPSGLSYTLGYTYEDGEETACTFEAQGCPCECTLGTCPDDSSTTLFSLNCPGIPLVDLCEEGLAEEELLDILLELDECVDGGTNVADLTNQPDETEAPTMGGTPMGTSGATVVDTMVQTGVEPEVGEEDEGEDSTAVEAAEAEVATP